MEAGRVIAARYSLIERLGSGGTGTVWRGFDQQLQREVAIKEVRLAPGLLEEERARVGEQALQEARHSARLTHPRIVAVYDLVSEAGRPYLVMQYVPGRMLQAVVHEEGPLPVPRVRMIAGQLLEALETAHAAGVVHRDVKPSNVMVAQDGSVLLTDFSLAKPVQGQTTTGVGWMSSPGYTAPERVVSGPVGPAADLFGLGATLYFALEGRGAFDRDEAVAGVFAAAVHPHPRPVRAGDLTELLDRLLAKDPAERATIAQARALLGIAGPQPLATAAARPGGVIGAGPPAVPGEVADVMVVPATPIAPEIVLGPDGEPSSHSLWAAILVRHRVALRTGALLAGLVTIAAFAVVPLLYDSVNSHQSTSLDVTSPVDTTTASVTSDDTSVPGATGATPNPVGPSDPNSTSSPAPAGSPPPPEPVRPPLVVNAALTIRVAQHTFSVDASGSRVNGGTIESYTFNFADGTVVGPQPGATASHTYASPGSYTVTVTVRATSGAIGTRQVTANALAVLPMAVLSVSLKTVPLPAPPGGTVQVVLANAGSSRPGDYPLASYTVDWGGGRTVTAAWGSSNQSGIVLSDCQSVTLTVTDTKGNVSASVTGAC
jgi:serine/threonine protein kinase